MEPSQPTQSTLSEQHVKKNRMPKWLTTVTPLSRVLTLSMLIIFPILGFYLGMIYQKKTNINQEDSKVIQINKTSNLDKTNSNILVYPISQTNSEVDTSNWKTYSISTNPVNYSIAFPADWQKAYPGDGGSTNYVSPDKLIEVITESSVRGLGRTVYDTIEKVANLATTGGETNIYRNTLKIDTHDALIQESTSNDETRVSLYISGFTSHTYDAKGKILSSEPAYITIEFVIDKNREELARQYIKNIITTIRFTN